MLSHPCRALLLPLLLLPLLPLSACGGGGKQDRPELVSSYPAPGSTVSLGLEEMRLDFDEPIRLFLAQALVLRVDGVVQGVRVFQLASEDRSIRLRPLNTTTFRPGAYSVEVIPGLVLDADDHYALGPTRYDFAVGGSPSVFLGSPATASVREVDPTTFALIHSTATPGGRAPVAVLPTRIGDATRVYVQLASGGGSGRALAWFEPGQAAMTEVALTPPPAGDFAAPAPALALTPDGRSLVAAFRETATGRVQLVRVRVSDAAQTGALPLSVVAGPGTEPRALVPREDEATLLVACATGVTGAVAYVDLPGFAEVDRDAALPGVQPAAVPAPPGASDRYGDTLLSALPDSGTALLLTLTLGSDAPAIVASPQIGAPRSLLTTYDGRWVLEGLAALPGSGALLAVRPGFDLLAAQPLALSDLVGALPAGVTTVRSLTRMAGLRSAYALLDGEALARLSWTDEAVTQDDLDAATPGVQVADLSAVAPGSTCLGALLGAVAP